MPDLERQLLEYASRLNVRYPDVSAEEILEPDVPVLRNHGSVAIRQGPWRFRAPAWGLALVVLAAGLLMIGQLLDRSEDSATPAQDLGVFEPIRGWIVYNKGLDLEAIDPAHPTIRHTFEIPYAESSLQDPRGAVPAGWSADGSILALADEYDGHLYLMDQKGSVTRIPIERLPDAPMGCCWFVTSPWLSPDGGYAAIAGGPGLYITDLTNIDASRSLEIDRGLGDLFITAWSPDGSEIALIDGEEPTLQVIEVATGARRQLIDRQFGHVRQIAWSPDGLQLLVIAGDAIPFNRMLNPLVRPKSTSLFLVNADGSNLRAIKRGHYVAVAWSPDGTQIAAIDFKEGHRHVVVMDADGSGEQVLAELPVTELFTGLAWHPVP